MSAGQRMRDRGRSAPRSRPTPCRQAMRPCFGASGFAPSDFALADLALALATENATPQPHTLPTPALWRRRPRQNASTRFSNAFDPASKASDAASQTDDFFLFHCGLLASVIVAQHFVARRE